MDAFDLSKLSDSRSEDIDLTRSGIIRSKVGPLFAIFWLVPPILIACFIWRFAVDVPYWDDYVTGQTFWSFISHSLNWPMLFRQHNESRPIFPRLLFIMLDLISRGDVRYQMGASFCAIVCTGLLMIYICRNTINHQLVALALALMINFMLFSSVQWANLLWGIQFIVFVPLLALSVVILGIGSPLKLWVSVPISIVAATVSTYSNSNGQIVWVLAVPLFLLHPSSSKNRALGIWIIFAVIFVGYYFHNYEKTPNQPSMWLPFLHPFSGIRFVLAFLGNGVRQTDNINTDVALGLVALSIWGAGVGYVALICQSPQIRSKAIPWIIFGGYSLGSGVLATLGRFGEGMSSAISERYPTFAIPLWFSMGPLWIVILGCREPKKTKFEKFLLPISSAMVVVVTVLMIKGCLYTWDEAVRFNSRLLSGRTAAQFALVAPDYEALATIHPDYFFVRNIIGLLDHADLFHPQCFHSSDVSTIAVEGKQSSSGCFDSVKSEGNILTLTGWAYIPVHRALADAILLTTPDGTGIERVFAIVVDKRGSRPDVAALTHLQMMGRSGWRKIITKDRLPRGAVISAWAYDTYSRRAYRLAGTHQIP